MRLHVLLRALATLALAAPAAALGQAQPAVDLAAFGGEAANSRATGGQVVILQDPPGALPVLRAVSLTRRMSLLYVTDGGVRGIVGASETTRALPWLYRQEPSSSVPGAQLASNDQRMTKVSGAALAAAGSSAEMARILRAAVDRTCVTPAGVNTCGAHRVAVDDITPRFGALGARSAVGRQLNEAMAHLERIPSPWGGSYASRVEFAVAPAVSTSVTAGLGPNRTLGRDGLVHRRDYRDVFSAMARAGGVWLEMYHFTLDRRMVLFTAAEWRDVPVGVASFLRARRSWRDPLSYVHLLLGQTEGDGAPPGQACSTPGTPGGPTQPGYPPCAQRIPSCNVVPWRMPVRYPTYGEALLRKRARVEQRMVTAANSTLVPVLPAPAPLVVREPGTSPMQCQWARAQSGAVNTRMLANGPGAFRVEGAQAVTWGDMLRQFFVVP